MSKGRQWNQWQPTAKNEPVPKWDPWDGCPICGANPLPKGGEPTSTGERLELHHDHEEHDKWTARWRKGFDEDVAETADRMQPAADPSQWT